MFCIKNQKGDTIIEVMIALAVLMVVVTGGYTIATRSLNGARIAQERSEATKIAEGQLEAVNQRIDALNGSLVGLQSNDPPKGSFVGYDSTWGALGYPNSVSGFCVDDAGNAQVISGPPPVSNPNCRFGLYSVYITTSISRLNYDSANLANDKKQLSYKATVTWDRSGGGQGESVEIVGRYILQ
jgi:type II secretory pathway pseudopilin PulG